jgi:triosephosphate isomerase
MSHSRKYLITGNWKMNLNSAEGAELAQDVASLVGQQTDVSVCLSPTFTALESVSKVVNESNLPSRCTRYAPRSRRRLHRRNLLPRCCATSLRALSFSAIPERREYCGETDAIVNKKTLACPCRQS